MHKLQVFFAILAFYSALDCTNGDDLALDELLKTTAEVVRLRGYNAEDHFVTTSDGYILNLVRATNPLINNGRSGLRNKDPVLFLHGILFEARFFIMNSVGVEPNNYGDQDAGNMTVESLEEMLLKDPASRSLAFTALNFGHEVWLLNRRGTPESLGHIENDSQAYLSPLDDIIMSSLESITPLQLQDASLFAKPSASYLTNIQQSVNPRYWNYSLDEQAAIDLPEVIDYILEKSSRTKLSVVAHSAGGAIAIMSLINQPDLADKINKTLLWAPSFDLAALASSNPILGLAARIAPLLVGYLGPFPPTLLIPIIKTLEVVLCSNEVTRDTVCEAVVDFLFGPAGGQQLLLPGFAQSFPDAISYHDILQLTQSVIKEKMHYFDYENSAMNLAAYGQPLPPKYNVTRIRSTGLSLWMGNTDTLVPIGTAIAFLNDGLTVPVDLHFLNREGLFFNHISFAQHKDIARLLTIPSLKTLESI